MRTKRASEQQRQRDRPNLRHVAQGIEAGQANGPRQRDPQLSPVPFLRVAKLLERRPQNVLDDDQAAFGRDDDPLGSDRSVTDVGHTFVHRGGCRDKLTNYMERRIELERNRPLLRNTEKLRQPDAAYVVRDDHQRGRELVQSLDRANAPVRFVAEVRETARSFSKRELERGHGAELSAQPQNF